MCIRLKLISKLTITSTIHSRNNIITLSYFTHVIDAVKFDLSTTITRQIQFDTIQYTVPHYELGMLSFKMLYKSFLAMGKHLIPHAVPISLIRCRQNSQAVKKGVALFKNGQYKKKL